MCPFLSRPSSKKLSKLNLASQYAGLLVAGWFFFPLQQFVGFFWVVENQNGFSLEKKNRQKHPTPWFLLLKPSKKRGREKLLGIRSPFFKKIPKQQDFHTNDVCWLSGTSATRQGRLGKASGVLTGVVSDNHLKNGHCWMWNAMHFSWFLLFSLPFFYIMNFWEYASSHQILKLWLYNTLLLGQMLFVTSLQPEDQGLLEDRFLAFGSQTNQLRLVVYPIILDLFGWWLFYGVYPGFSTFVKPPIWVTYVWMFFFKHLKS